MFKGFLSRVGEERGKAGSRRRQKREEERVKRE